MNAVVFTFTGDEVTWRNADGSVPNCHNATHVYGKTAFCVNKTYVTDADFLYLISNFASLSQSAQART